MTERRVDPLPKEFECQSISLSPLIPSSSGTWTQRERKTGRGSTTPSWRSKGTGNDGGRGVELKEEHEERWHDILDAD